MNDYFVLNSQENKYFATSRTSSQSQKSMPQKSTSSAVADAERSLESAVKSYGSRKTSVVVKRYGLK